jgi:S-DNA-T family DNA segregation ATPase FtsK/SpoIIIE
VVTKTRGRAPTRAPARAAAKKPATRAKRAAPAPPPFWRVQARDLWAVGLITLGVLLALALWGHQLGPVGQWANTGLALLAGWARVLLPLVAVGAGCALLFDRGARRDDDTDDESGPGADPWRLGVGIVLGILGVCGLAELAKGAPRLSNSGALKNGGGYLGALVGRPLHAGIGTAGAAVLLVALIFVAVLVATGVPLAAVGRGLRTAVVASGRFAAEAWRGKPFVIVPEGSTNDVGAPTSPATALIDPEGLTDADDHADTEDDTDIDIPLDPAPVPPRPRPAAQVGPARTGGESRAPGEWVLPDLALLHQSKKLRQDQRLIDAAGEELVRALHAHGVETRLVGSRVGPTVTRYELELGPGVKVARVTTLSKDIAYAMASPDVRILAPIPGKSAIGVEVPNRTRQLVSLRDILESREAQSTDGHPLEVATGRDIAGRAVMSNLAEMPHILISGATGSGKSSCMNSIITSILMRDTPEQVKMILVDPKRVELGQYDGLPHLLNPVVVDPKKAANALAWAVKEMERRYDILAENGVRDITGYNQMVVEGLIAPPPSDRRRGRDAAAAALGEDHPAVEDSADIDDEPEPPQPLPFILVIVDELNDLMMVAARDVEDSIVRIAQMARAVGIHLVIATQRPSVDVITGVIKANIPSRMAFSVSSLADSRVILDQPGAERLIGKGDMLLLTASSNIARRLQAPWVSEEEVREVVRHWKSQGGQTEAIVGIDITENGPAGADVVDDDDDEYLAQARDLVVRSQLGSTSMLQRKLRVGFARAGRLMDLLERQGVVGPSEGSKARAVLMTPEELDSSSGR